MVDKIKKLIEDTIGEKVDFAVEATESREFGHYASNVAMRLSGILKDAPINIARSLAERLKTGDAQGFFEKIEAAPPGFINFWLSQKTLRQAFLKMRTMGVRWGRPPGRARGIKKTVVIDYSHPNIAKPMSVAHLRSTIIGQALYNIFKFSGWKTIGDNHLGDWGKQFGILIAAYKEAGLESKQITIDDLLNLYIAWSEKIKTNPVLDERVKAETKKLQSGDPENLKIWKLFYKISLAEFKKIYRKLGVDFDYYLGESFYRKMLPGVVAEALKKGVAKKSEGAIVIPLESLSPCLIKTRDETFLYATTDIAAVKYRIKKFKPNLILYVVDSGQSLHFEQVFSAVKKLSYLKDEKLVHVKFGLILSEDLKKLSTRAGRHIALDGVINEAVIKAQEIAEAKRPDLKVGERKKIAQAIGVGALKYNDLSQNRESNIAFRWEKMLNLEGNSAPYLMYTYARLRSILRKDTPGNLNPDYLETPPEFELILKLLQFPEIVERVTQDFYPHHLTDYLWELAQTANSFYHSEPVLKAKTGVREARLHLVSQAAVTLKTGLNLLGIKTLESI